MSPANLDNFDNYDYVQLLDNVTGEVIELKTGSEYQFYSEVGDFNRFTLILSNLSNPIESESLSLDDTENDLNVYNNGSDLVIVSDKHLGDAQVMIYNLSGQLVNTSYIYDNKGSSIVSVPLNLKGVFIVMITTNSETYSKKAKI